MTTSRGVNVTGSTTINAVLETAQELNVPVIVQFSNGGAAFMVGKIAAVASIDFKPDPPAF